jgi:hypothetical protein
MVYKQTYYSIKETILFDAGGSLVPFGLPKEYDLFYSNQGGDWNDFARNWTLAKASFKRLITELGIKVVLWQSAPLTRVRGCK